MDRKLVLYSDQVIPENAVVDQRMLRLIDKPHPVIGYVPSSSDTDRFYFKQKRSYYAALGASLDVYFELDRSFSEQTLPELLSCDAIHLSGGNTFYFLYWLKQRAMLPVLHDYVAKGGVLVGTSAGAIVMTPNISSAELCGDKPVEASSDLSALGLVDFQFYPHFQANDVDIKAAKAHQQQTFTSLYACPDGGGIVIDGAHMELFGAVRKFDTVLS